MTWAASPVRTVSRQTPLPKVRGAKQGHRVRGGGGLRQGTEVRVRGWQLPEAQPHLVSPAGRVASFSMPGSSYRYSLGPSLGRGPEAGERVQSSEMGLSVLIMQPILRFLQLLCENHNRDLQVST